MKLRKTSFFIIFSKVVLKYYPWQPDKFLKAIQKFNNGRHYQCEVIQYWQNTRSARQRLITLCYRKNSKIHNLRVWSFFMFFGRWICFWHPISSITSTFCFTWGHYFLITKRVLRHIRHFLTYLWRHQCRIFSSFFSF